MASICTEGCKLFRSEQWNSITRLPISQCISFPSPKIVSAITGACMQDAAGHSNFHVGHLPRSDAGGSRIPQLVASKRRSSEDVSGKGKGKYLPVPRASISLLDHLKVKGLGEHEMVFSLVLRCGAVRCYRNTNPHRLQIPSHRPLALQVTTSRTKSCRSSHAE